MSAKAIEREGPKMGAREGEGERGECACAMAEAKGRGCLPS